jgi:hypothetical protein
VRRNGILKESRMRRTSRLTLMLNSREMRALTVYCSRYRIQNKSEFLRETLMKEIVRRFNDEHPTLWEVGEPDLFNGGANG